jgi:hypothetical protein
MRLSLLRVFTLITPVHPCIKIKQDMWITWLKFAAKFSSKWLSFQPESTDEPAKREECMKEITRLMTVRRVGLFEDPYRRR